MSTIAAGPFDRAGRPLHGHIWPVGHDRLAYLRTPRTLVWDGVPKEAYWQTSETGDGDERQSV
jgi:hypothetical protein